MSDRDDGAPEDRLGPTTADDLLGGGGETSLLEAVDGLLERGVMLEGDLVLGLADVDLIYLRLSTLLAAADRILRTAPPGTEPSGELRSGPGSEPPPAPEPSAERPTRETIRDERPPEAPAPADPATASVDALRERLEESLGGERRSAATGDAAEPARLGTASPEGGPPAGGAAAPRWNASPEDVERSVARLVLALVDFLRQLMERQAIRRMEQGTLTEEEVERLGQALMRLEETVHEMARRFGLDPEDLNLDLGPLGSLT